MYKGEHQILVRLASQIEEGNRTSQTVDGQVKREAKRTVIQPNLTVAQTCLKSFILLSASVHL